MMKTAQAHAERIFMDRLQIITVKDRVIGLDCKHLRHDPLPLSAL